MPKDREDRKKEKREKKEKKEKKERKRREAEELAVREKKISKKHKSKSKEPAEKPEKKPKKKSKKLQVAEEKKPHKKKPNKKHKNIPSESESESEDDPETVTVPSVKIPITTTTNESDSDSDFDKEDLKHLLETYTKEDLINLIHKTAEKSSRLISAVLESAELDSSKRNIFVRGLGWDTTHETLKSAFEAYGEIEECSVVMDKDTGRAKGYGFVMFKTRKGCREALRNPEKRMFNRTVTCNLAAAKPAGAGKPREPVESVKIDLSQSQSQSEVVLPGPPPQGMDLGYGLDKGHKQQSGPPPMFGGQNMNMPFYAPPGGYNPMYAAFMGNQMGPGGGVPNFPMFGPGLMNHGPPNHMGMAGQFGGEGNGGVGPGFDGERAWYLR